MTSTEAINRVPGPHLVYCSVNLPAGPSDLFDSPCSCRLVVADWLRAEADQARRALAPPGVWHFNSNAWDAFFAETGRPALRFRNDMTQAECLALVAERNRARARGDYARADQVRADLAFYGFSLVDLPNGAVRITR